MSDRLLTDKEVEAITLRAIAAPVVAYSQGGKQIDQIVGADIPALLHDNALLRSYLDNYEEMLLCSERLTQTALEQRNLLRDGLRAAIGALEPFAELFVVGDPITDQHVEYFHDWRDVCAARAALAHPAVVALKGETDATGHA